MEKYAVLTAMGPDRIGIADDITNHILAQKCNIEESRMSVLGGEFAVILLLRGYEEVLLSMMEELPSMGSSLNLKIEMKLTEPQQKSQLSRPYLIESISLDNPGIVHAITSHLRSYQINVEDLETETTSAPWTGAPMFIMKIRVTIPSEVSVHDVKHDLLQIGNNQDLDIKIMPLTASRVTNK